jgi:hypothetical protein
MEPTDDRPLAPTAPPPPSAPAIEHEPHRRSAWRTAAIVVVVVLALALFVALHLGHR